MEIAVIGEICSEPTGPTGPGPALEAYLLGNVSFDAALALQRRLVYEISGDRDRAALVVCEHPPLVTVGRQGSATHIVCEPRELQARGWPVRWVNRGGGCMLHLPGQLAIHPILPLDRFGLGLQDYVDRLQQVLGDVLADFEVPGEVRRDWPGVWAGGRLIAGVGVAVCDWVSYYGAYLNINPLLLPFRHVRCAGAGGGPMTSLERERHRPVRASLVRERLLEHFATRFPVARTSLFSDHPSLSRKAGSDALASRA
jgi:lipoyl(octanoyl) transferase